MVVIKAEESCLWVRNGGIAGTGKKHPPSEPQKQHWSGKHAFEVGDMGRVSAKNQACHCPNWRLPSTHSLAFLSKSFGKILTTYMKLFTFILDFIFMCVQF